MASKKNLFVFSFLFLQHIIFSSGEYVNGGYWSLASQYPASNINATLYTHLFCAFANLDSQKNQLTIPQSESDQVSSFTTTVQEMNPSIETLLSIGGANADRSAFASMVGQSSARATFINSSINLARLYNFHGLDLDWEYPQTGFQMAKLSNLLNEWRSAINNEARNTSKPRLLLTATVYYSPTVKNGVTYPIQAITSSLDWINLKAYDFYRPSTSNVTNAPAQLFDSSNLTSGGGGVEAWMLAGVPARKLVLGIPFFGYGWVLVDNHVNGMFAPAIHQEGFADMPVGYNEIVEHLINGRENGATKVYNGTMVTNYFNDQGRWYGYDDVESVIVKVAFARIKGYSVILHGMLEMIFVILFLQ